MGFEDELRDLICLFIIEAIAIVPDDVGGAVASVDKWLEDGLWSCIKLQNLVCQRDIFFFFINETS